MTQYRYAGVDEAGSKVRGVVEAPSLTAARFEVLSRHVEIAKLSEKRSVGQFELTAKKVKHDELMLLCRQLAAFVRSGLPLIEGIETIAAEQRKSALARILAEVADSLRSGETLSDALDQHSAALPTYFVPMVRAAELSGTIDLVLDRIASYLERTLETKRAIKSALTYPVIVLCLAAATVTVLVGFVLPRFERFFTELDAKLPATTRFLLALADFTGRWGSVIMAALVASIVAIVVFLRTTPGHNARDRMLLRLPVLGGIVRFGVVERVCRILSAMVRSGVTLPVAVTVTAETSNNVVYHRALLVARDEMMRGEGLAEPIAGTGLFPAAATQMLRVGESTGTVDLQLETAADFYEQELRHRVKRLTTLFEPAIIIVLGVVVGFVALSLVQAMYGVFQTGSLK